MLYTWMKWQFCISSSSFKNWANRQNYQKWMEKVEPKAVYVIQLMNNHMRSSTELIVTLLKILFVALATTLNVQSHFSKIIHISHSFVSRFELRTKMHADMCPLTDTLFHIQPLTFSTGTVLSHPYVSTNQLLRHESVILAAAYGLWTNVANKFSF